VISSGCRFTKEFPILTFRTRCFHDQQAIRANLPWIVPLVLVTLSSSACRSRSLVSVHEAPDQRNLPSQLGLPNQVTWQELKETRSGHIGRTPWSDTWWPFPKLGIAHRWTLKDLVNPSTQDVPAHLHAMLTEMQSALASKDQRRIAALSPAEKYDFIQSGGRLPLTDMIGKTVQEPVAAETEPLKSYLAAVRKKDRLAFNLLSEIRKDELENPNSQDIPDKYQKLQTLGLELTKLRDPAVRGHLSTFAALIADHAQSIQGQAHLVADAWRTYANFLPRFASSHLWRWMGICHGWSLAALNEPPPKHGVLVTLGDTKVLFNQGDLRGLLTKVWADQSAPAQLAGTRCDVDYRDLAKNQTDELGRVVDARICDGHDVNYACSQGKAVSFVDKDFEDGMLTYRDSASNKVKIGVIVATQGAYSAFHIQEHDSLAAFHEARKANRVGRPRTLQNFSACRDLNPMTFHLANHFLVRPGGSGYVIDRARGSEVWNQPVFAYETKIIAATDGQGRALGANDLIPVTAIDDLFSDFRAKGHDHRTAYLLQLETTITYVEDSGPKITYLNEDTTPMTVQYTLEFDDNHILRGGEWGLIPTPENAAFQDQARWRNSDFAPDFIWMVAPNQKPVYGPIDYALIQELLDCSRQDTNVQTTTWPTTNETITYVPCALD
jgi:hypothetical protein